MKVWLLILRQNDNSWHKPHVLHQIHLKLLISSNLKYKTVILKEKTIRENLCGLWLFWNSQKKNIDKLDYPGKKILLRPTRVKILTNHISSKRFLFQILKCLSNLNSKETIQIGNWIHLTREDVLVAN